MYCVSIGFTKKEMKKTNRWLESNKVKERRKRGKVRGRLGKEGGEGGKGEREGENFDKHKIAWAKFHYPLGGKADVSTFVTFFIIHLQILMSKKTKY